MKEQEGYCGICIFRSLEERFPEDFRAWLQNLMRLHSWVKAGYPLDPAELGFEGWQALAVITRYFEVKDIEATMPRSEA